MELEHAPTVCRYDACTLGPDGGPAPLVQPMRGGNLREYCSDRHRIAAHRARQRRPVAVAGTSGDGAAPPSEVATQLSALAERLARLAGEVDRALALADADRLARKLEAGRLQAVEAEARAAAVAAERDRERAAASAFREMADEAVTRAERATSRAEAAEAARDGAQEALRRAEEERDDERQAREGAEAERAGAETEGQALAAERDRLAEALRTAEASPGGRHPGR